MKFIDTAKEIYHQVVDKTKEDKKYDEKVVLQETKQNLLDLKENVSYISSVLTELKKAGWIDEQKYNALNAKVLDKNTQQEAAQEISNIVGDIYQRYDTLQSDEKTKVNMVTDALWKSKQSLSGLKNEVMKYTNVDFEKLETELIDEATVKMNEHRYSKWLVGSYKEHIHEKIEELKTGTKHEDANAWQKFTHSVKDMFFGLVGSRFVGKDLKDVLTEKLGKFKDKAVETAEGIKDKGKKLVDEITPEKLKEKEKNLRSYVVVMMKKYGKNIDAATIDRVMKRIDIKKLAADSTPEVQKLFTSNWEDANVVTSLFEAVKLPFHAFFELVGALQEEGVISYSDVAYHVMGDIVSYGLK